MCLKSWHIGGGGLWLTWEEGKEKVENIMRKRRRGKKEVGKRVAKKGILW